MHIWGCSAMCDVCLVPHGRCVIDLIIAIQVVRLGSLTADSQCQSCFIDICIYICIIIYHIKTISSAYSISCNMPYFISFVTRSTMMANNGGDKDKIPNVLQLLLQALQKNMLQLLLLSLHLYAGSSLL